MGRCIYGGIYEPGSPLSDDNGFRKDVIEAMREADVPVVRYPGGNFVATYHWEDGVGPRDRRPKRPELAWLGIEPNSFGTDEFMRWLEVLSEGRETRVEPYLCLNFGTGTLDEALNWVEYCNGTGDTKYANLRRQNGHPEPYRVKYWALGNEVWGPWQVLQATASDYAKKAFQWAKSIRLLDPSVKLVLCGETGYAAWDLAVLRECVSLVDMHSIHIYTAAAGRNNHMKNVTAPLSAERAIITAAAMIDVAFIESSLENSGSVVALTAGAHLDKPIPKICFDEWNVWDPERAPGDKGAEERYTLSDALAVGIWLNVFVRQARYLGMCNIAQSVNVISPLTTTADGIIHQTTWWPYMLFSRYMRGISLATHVTCPVYTGPTNPAWLQQVLTENGVSGGGGGGGAPILDVSAALSEDGSTVTLAVVNISPDMDYETILRGLEDSSCDGEKEVMVYTVTGPDIMCTNTESESTVKVQERLDKILGGRFTFPKLSLTMLRFEA